MSHSSINFLEKKFRGKISSELCVKDGNKVKCIYKVGKMQISIEPKESSLLMEKVKDYPN